MGCVASFFVSLFRVLCSKSLSSLSLQPKMLPLDTLYFSRRIFLRFPPFLPIRVDSLHSLEFYSLSSTCSVLFKFHFACYIVELNGVIHIRVDRLALSLSQQLHNWLRALALKLRKCTSLFFNESFKHITTPATATNASFESFKWRYEAGPSRGRIATFKIACFDI
jgi:hypothetical protein